MRISVKVLKGNECEVTVTPDITVLQVKELLQSQVSIPVDQQKLIYLGKTLADDKSLSSYKIKDGGKLFLMLKKPGAGKTPGTANSTPSVTPTVTPMAIDPVTPAPITDDPVRFWEKLEAFLKRHFTEKDAQKVLLQFKKDMDGGMEKMSLDDIERHSFRCLEAREGYYHQALS